MARAKTPHKYKPEFVELSRNYCQLGAIDDDLAVFFNVSKRMIISWRKKYPDFNEACTEGKEIADNKVKRSLFERATGYSHPEEKIFCTNGMVTKVDSIKHYPPDTTAAIFWLKNRDPENWKDVHKIDHSGQVTHVHEISDEELERIATGGRAGAAKAQRGEKKPSSVH